MLPFFFSRCRSNSTASCPPPLSESSMDGVRLLKGPPLLHKKEGMMFRLLPGPKGRRIILALSCPRQWIETRLFAVTYSRQLTLWFPSPFGASKTQLPFAFSSFFCDGRRLRPRLSSPFSRTECLILSLTPVSFFLLSAGDQDKLDPSNLKFSPLPLRGEMNFPFSPFLADENARRVFYVTHFP